MLYTYFNALLSFYFEIGTHLISTGGWPEIDEISADMNSVE